MSITKENTSTEIKKDNRTYIVQLADALRNARVQTLAERTVIPWKDRQRGKKGQTFWARKLDRITLEMHKRDATHLAR